MMRVAIITSEGSADFQRYRQHGCITSECMAWKWDREPPVNMHDEGSVLYSKVEGYCGLIEK